MPVQLHTGFRHLTMPQPLGAAGFVNISMHKGGIVSLSPSESNPDTSPLASSVKFIVEQPYNISVMQNSFILNSPITGKPTEALSAVNITEIADKQSRTFADLLLSARDVATTFQNDIEGEPGNG